MNATPRRRRIFNGGRHERWSWQVVIGPDAVKRVPWLAVFGQRPAAHAGRP
jgi:hypothetical protein